MKKNSFACVYMGNISQYDTGVRCGPWAYFFSSRIYMHIVIKTFFFCNSNTCVIHLKGYHAVHKSNDATDLHIECY
jgi:hypothetical protein